MARFLSGGRSTLQTALAGIERKLAFWEAGGPVFAFGVRDADTGELIGMAEANMAAPGRKVGEANISYGLHPIARGKGFATRAVRLLLQFLESFTEAHTAVAWIDPRNEASLRVAERVGMRRTQTITDDEGLVKIVLERSVRS